MEHRQQLRKDAVRSELKFGGEGNGSGQQPRLSITGPFGIAGGPTGIEQCCQRCRVGYVTADPVGRLHCIVVGFAASVRSDVPRTRNIKLRSGVRESMGHGSAVPGAVGDNLRELRHGQPGVQRSQDKARALCCDLQLSDSI